VLRRIVLPLTMPAVASIWIYVFLYLIRDLSLPIMLAGPSNRLIALVILDLWNDGKVPQVGALSVLLALTAAALGWMFMRLPALRCRHGLARRAVLPGHKKGEQTVTLTPPIADPAVASAAIRAS
jgi:ABC-type Fe3+ transport system permease subunit